MPSGIIVSSPPTSNVSIVATDILSMPPPQISLVVVIPIYSITISFVSFVVASLCIFDGSNPQIGVIPTPLISKLDVVIMPVTTIVPA